MLGMDAIVARLAAQYVRRAAPLMPFSFLFVLLARFLQSQACTVGASALINSSHLNAKNIVLPFVWIGLGANVVNVAGSYLFIVVLQWVRHYILAYCMTCVTSLAGAVWQHMCTRARLCHTIAVDVAVRVAFL